MFHILWQVPQRLSYRKHKKDSRDMAKICSYANLIKIGCGVWAVERWTDNNQTSFPKITFWNFKDLLVQLIYPYQGFRRHVNVSLNAYARIFDNVKITSVISTRNHINFCSFFYVRFIRIWINLHIPPKCIWVYSHFTIWVNFGKFGILLQLQ